MLTGIQGLSFKGYPPYYKVKCIDTNQANKLMHEMEAALKNIDYYKGKGSEVMVQAMQNTKNVKAMLDCMEKVSKPKSPAENAANIYRSFDKKQPDPPKVNVRL